MPDNPIDKLKDEIEQRVRVAARDAVIKWTAILYIVRKALRL